MRKINPFHLAFPVDDMEKARHFYGTILGFAEARSSERWIDFNLFGHQIVTHLAPEKIVQHHNPVDGHEVPVPHFGVVLDWDEFHAFAQRIKAAGVSFVIEPYIRFKGQVGDRRRCFFWTRPAMHWNSNRSSIRLNCSRSRSDRSSHGRACLPAFIYIHVEGKLCHSPAPRTTI